MSVHITYFVHGTTTDNLQDISSGWSDVELSEKGILQPPVKYLFILNLEAIAFAICLYHP